MSLQRLLENKVYDAVDDAGGAYSRPCLWGGGGRLIFHGPRTTASGVGPYFPVTPVMSSHSCTCIAFLGVGIAP